MANHPSSGREVIESTLPVTFENPLYLVGDVVKVTLDDGFNYDKTVTVQGTVTFVVGETPV